ncbi:type II toxin-antitoxin system RelE family toxin [Desulfobacter postgatei]|uniref:type II toxin-antitoxin system RelE family toxin n=1 Tax=Desulfobacter postgatei TaxID=2293 RepID=UPI000A067C7E|nr:type II toxin-antitoxin system RelE/ParE family toxin [Desulfobacter postgatei]
MQLKPKKLTIQERYRYKVGKYRILYSIQDQELTIWVVKISHRKGFGIQGIGFRGDLT